MFKTASGDKTCQLQFYLVSNIVSVLTRTAEQSYVADTRDFSVLLNILNISYLIFKITLSPLSPTSPNGPGNPGAPGGPWKLKTIPFFIFRI